jgi:Tol biopolymer transport system component/DNA-binding winged helix-turn-helix (wHTH) protein
MTRQRDNGSGRSTAGEGLPGVLRFGPFAFETGACRLSRDGLELHLTPKAAAVLCHMLQNPGALISKDEFLEVVWQGVHVREESLTQAISVIRQMLGDSAQSPQFIQTVSGEGYRFVGRVTSGDDEAFVASPRDKQTAGKSRTVSDVLRRRRAPAPVWLRRTTFAASAVVLLALLALAAGWVELPPGTRSTGSIADVPEIAPLTFDGGRKENPALSPDGNFVAFDWAGPDGDNRDIWVLQIGVGTTAKRVTTDPSADLAPVWSPDGQSLAFVRIRDGEPAIYRVPWTGGMERKLVDVDMPFHPAGRVRLSWSPDDLLAFPQATGGPMPITEAANSRILLLDMEQPEQEPRALTTPPGGGAIGDRFPRFSPDGREIAFVRSSSPTGGKDIWLQGVNDTEARQITFEGWRFCDDLTWTPDGEEIVFMAGISQRRRIYRVRPDDGSFRLIEGLGDNYRWPTFAGERLVVGQATVGPRQIWEAPGRHAEDRFAPARRLIESSYWDGESAYSADSARIAWVTRRTGPHTIWTAGRDGSSQQLLFPWDGQLWGPSWSPDGTGIAFDSNAEGSNDVYVVDVESGHIEKLTRNETNDMSPTFSRDGKYIYFTSDRSGEYQIYRMSADRGEAAEPAVALTRQGGTFHLVESMDGFLYYAKREGQTGIWRIPADGGPEEEFFAGPIMFGVDWDLVESGIYYGIRSDGGFTVYYRSFDSDQSEVVFRGDGWFIWLRVAPDERSFVYSMNDPGSSSELVLMEGFR